MKRQILAASLVLGLLVSPFSSPSAQTVDLGGLRLGAQFGPAEREVARSAVAAVTPPQVTTVRHATGQTAFVMTRYHGSGNFNVLTDASGRILSIGIHVAWPQTRPASEVMRETTAMFGDATKVEEDDDGFLYEAYRGSRGELLSGDANAAKREACAAAAGDFVGAILGSARITLAVPQIAIPDYCGVMVEVVAERLDGMPARQVSNVLQDALDVARIRASATPPR